MSQEDFRAHLIRYGGDPYPHVVEKALGCYVWDETGRKVLDFLLWVAFFLPVLPVLLGWILLFDPDFGLANEWAKAWGLAEGSLFNLYSFWGIIFIHLVTHSIGVKVMLLTPAFRNLDGSIEDAARMCGASRWPWPTPGRAAASVAG